MSKVNFKDPLPFIHKQKCLGGYVELQNGAHVFKDGSGFKQLLKKTEYEQIVTANVGTKIEVPKETVTAEPKPKLSRQEELEALTQKDLLPIAEELYEEVGKRTKKEKLIKMIIEAEEDDDS